MSEILNIPTKPLNTAEEAMKVVLGDRQQAYGSPVENHTRTANLWSVYVENAIKKGFLTPEDVCYMNILQKISRSMEHDKRDNIVDIIGYALNVEIIKQDGGQKW